MAAHGLAGAGWLRKYGPALLAALSTLFFGYVATRDVDAAAAWRALGEAQLLWLVPSAAALAVAIFLRAWRWQLMFEPRSRPPFGAVSRSLLLGYLFNNVLPMRAGELVRIETLHQDTRTPRAEALATVVIERLFDVLSLLALLFSAVLWLPAVSWLRQAAIAALVAVAVLIAVVAALSLYGDRAVRILLAPLRLVPAFRTARLEHAVQNIMRGCVAVRDLGTSLRVFAVTTASWLVMGFSFWLLGLGFDLDIPPSAGLLVVITVNLTLILPSAPGGLGLFEAATVVALHAYGVDQSEALSYGLVLHALNFVPFVAIGAIILARRPTVRSPRKDPHVDERATIASLR